jgi:FlaA1/EpsC-like NDP-sugar epimerase
VRPGEKLFEELAHQDEEMLATFHKKIKIFAGNGLPDSRTIESIRRFRDFCAVRDASGIILELKELIPDYNPSAHLLRQLIPSPGEAGPTKSRSAAAGM